MSFAKNRWHWMLKKPRKWHLVAAAAGVMLMEAFMWRHHPWVAEAQTILQSGRIGELRLVKNGFSFSIQPGDWRLDPARGGGALFDLGCYGINLSRLFAGDDRMEILARSRMGETGVDLTTAMILRFGNGVKALLDCSFECRDRNRIELVGTKGSLELPQGVLPPAEAEMIITTESGQEKKRFAKAHQFIGELLAFAAVSRKAGCQRQPKMVGPICVFLMRSNAKHGSSFLMCGKARLLPSRIPQRSSLLNVPL